MQRVEVLGVRIEQPTNQPIVLLRQPDRDRYLPIWIGAAEATAIAYAHQGIVPPRPLTHDLFSTTLERLGHRLAAVEIVRLEDGVFYAEIVVDEITRIESRSSDAIALAIRAGCPIMVDDEIIDAAGVTISQESDEDEVEKFKEFLDQVSADDFDDNDQL